MDNLLVCLNLGSDLLSQLLRLAIAHRIYLWINVCGLGALFTKVGGVVVATGVLCEAPVPHPFSTNMDSKLISCEFVVAVVVADVVVVIGTVDVAKLLSTLFFAVSFREKSSGLPCSAWTMTKLRLWNKKMSLKVTIQLGPVIRPPGNKSIRITRLIAIGLVIWPEGQDSEINQFRYPAKTGFVIRQAR